MKFLTDQQRSELRARHKLERDRRICDRIKAVLLFDKGWTYEEIAEALLLSEGAIKNHIGEYQIENKFVPGGGGSTEKLSENQSKILEAHLTEHTYLYVKDIASYIYSRWKIVYTVSGLRNWLQRQIFLIGNPRLCQEKLIPSSKKNGSLNMRNLKQICLQKRPFVLQMEFIRPITFNQLMDGLRKVNTKQFLQMLDEIDLTWQAP